MENAVDKPQKFPSIPHPKNSPNPVEVPELLVKSGWLYAKVELLKRKYKDRFFSLGPGVLRVYDQDIQNPKRAMKAAFSLGIISGMTILDNPPSKIAKKLTPSQVAWEIETTTQKISVISNSREEAESWISTIQAIKKQCDDESKRGIVRCDSCLQITKRKDLNDRTPCWYCGFEPRLWINGTGGVNDLIFNG